MPNRSKDRPRCFGSKGSASRSPMIDGDCVMKVSPLRMTVAPPAARTLRTQSTLVP